MVLVMMMATMMMMMMMMTMIMCDMCIIYQCQTKNKTEYVYKS